MNDAASIAALQRRTLWVLGAGQVAGSAALGAAVTVGAFVVQDFLGAETPWAGAATATVTAGSAVCSRLLSVYMQRVGRRHGMTSGYVLATIGSLLAVVSIEVGALWLFLVGLAAFGAGQAANLLARYAATDLAAPERRSTAMSTVVFASTFGAVFGPVAIGPAERAGVSWFGLQQYSGPWLLAGLLFVLAGLNTVLRLRPDPLLLARQLHHARAGGGVPVAREKVSLAECLRLSTATPGGRLGLTAMVISQTTMVAVMAMTPVHMRLHGHEGLSQYVVSLHIAGMYAFAPFIGRYADRAGRTRTIQAAAVILFGAMLLSAVSGDSYALLFPALWGLGVGWNFGLIGGSALLSESVPETRRVSVQGVADLLMSVGGGSAGFASGFVRRMIGYHALAAVGLFLAGLLFVAVVVWGSSHGARGAKGSVLG